VVQLEINEQNRISLDLHNGQIERAPTSAPVVDEAILAILG